MRGLIAASPTVVAVRDWRMESHAPTRAKSARTASAVAVCRHRWYLLSIDDPRQMMRTGETVYKELDLATADRDALLDAMTKHPILIERPIVICGDRAVIARPPEKLLDLF